MSMNSASFDWKGRLRASGTHMLLSAVVAALVASLVFLIWYPSPHRDLVGGRELFLLVMGVDLVMGPALTFVAFNRKKTFNHLARDLGIIAVLQLAALGFGLHTVYLARPVHINFEIDRLRIITAADIDPETLREAPKDLQELPISGPIQIASVKPSEEKAMLKSTELAMAGFDLSQQPMTWRPMDEVVKLTLWNRATPIETLKSQLKIRNNQDVAKLEALVSKASQVVCKDCNNSELRAIPLMSKRMSWTALIDKNGQVRGATDVDMF
jgi:hypothetical protein